jgi:hypothetical protein
MEWLCEATPEEIVRVGRRTNTVRELEAAVRKYTVCDRENKEEKHI